MDNYKHTLNLPYTKFPMRGNLIKNELRILNKWNKNNIYQKIRNVRKNNKIFLLHDGPPYANGDIHIGHAINKILKDIIIKFKTLMNFNSPYIPGWDCHGLPIELIVEKKIGKPNINKNNLSEFRIACRKYANEQVKKQKIKFMRLGVLGDWENPYLTMDYSMEANIIRTLGKIIAKGYLKRGNKPIFWCIHCSSSLADMEIEYNDHSSLSTYILFSAINPNLLANKFGLNNFFYNIHLIIWTTTPWTLPFNRAVAFHPKLIYQLLKIKNKYYILEKKLVSNILEKLKVNNYKVISSTYGKNLENIYFNHPFMKYTVPSILNNSISSNMGTGIVHIAPGHGLDDYNLAKKYNLEIYSNISSGGFYLPGTFLELDGLNIFKCNNVLLKILKKNNNLFYSEYIRHSYPYCWRHKKPVIFRSTAQWFIDLDKNNLREKLLFNIDNVNWIPEHNRDNIKKMVLSRPDWCISRQRCWGIPITLFINRKTYNLHPNTNKFIELIAKLVEKHGIQIWWDLDIDYFLGNESNQYIKVLDTLDVWFDSGSTHDSVVAKIKDFNSYKSDIYLEGLDQHRGWFMSSLIISTIIYNQAPYKKVLTHGFAVDNQGQKMSKSVGNVINPEFIFNNLGADILRILVASNDYSNNIHISKNSINQSVNYYRKIRNTVRFILANINDFDPKNNLIKYENMLSIDRLIIFILKKTQKKIINFYEKYDFHNVIKCIIHFCSIDMGSFYLEIIKDRQYTSQKDSLMRYSCQTVLYHVIESLVRWISPIISFTADEIWQYIPGNRSEFIFTETFYSYLDNFNINQLKLIEHYNYWQFMLKIRNEINKFIEQAIESKYISQSLEANVMIYADSSLVKKLNILEYELKFFLLVSSVNVDDYNNSNSNAIKSDNIDNFKLYIKKAKGNKCKRCWHYDISVGLDPKNFDICKRCIKNIYGTGEIRKFV